MITYKSRWLTRGEVWFDNEPEHGELDFIVYNQRTKPLPKTQTREFYTMVVDLRRTPEELLSRMEHNTVYKIKRARDREKIVCECCDVSDPAVLQDFADYYDPFARQRGWSLIDRHWLTRTAQAGALGLVRAKSPEGETLVYHSLIRAGDRVRGIHSPSYFRDSQDSSVRSYVSRANRYLHWHSMMHYKEQGVSIYDFGGWYMGTADASRLRINDFKKGFGGEIICNYNCEQILTLKAWFFLNVARKLQSAISRPAPSTPANEKSDQSN